MKRTKRNLANALLMVTALLGVGCVGSLAQNDRGGGRLAGTWDAVVTRTVCATGTPIPNQTFPSIANFNQGGTFLGSTSGIPQSLRTPEHGVWRHVSGNNYEFKFKSYSFDTMGVATGYVIIRHDVQLNDTADAYTSAGEATFYNMLGTQVGAGCSVAVGTRFTF